MHASQLFYQLSDIPSPILRLFFFLRARCMFLESTGLCRVVGKVSADRSQQGKAEPPTNVPRTLQFLKGLAHHLPQGHERTWKFNNPEHRAHRGPKTTL